MAEPFEFVGETPNNQKIKVFFLTLLGLVAVVGAGIALYAEFYDAFSSTAPFEAMREFIQQDVSSFTPTGLFYLGFVGGLFFVPLPIEIFYFTGLTHGNPIWYSLFLVIAGILPSQAVDYWIGSKFSPFVLQFISKKKVYKTKRWVNRYGSYAIFVFNLLPLPSPILTFALGIAKYNPIRLAVFLLLGTLIKFIAVAGIYVIFT